MTNFIKAFPFRKRAVFVILVLIIGNDSCCFSQSGFQVDLLPDQPEATVESRVVVYERNEGFFLHGRPVGMKLFRRDENKHGVAGLSIDSDGKYKLSNSLPMFINDSLITETQADQRFGKSRKFGNTHVYDLIGFIADEPNIYHLEMVFGKDKKVSKFRVRGFGITEFKFVQLNQKSRW